MGALFYNADNDESTHALCQGRNGDGVDKNGHASHLNLTGKMWQKIGIWSILEINC